MIETTLEALELLVQLLEIVGASALVLGFLMGTARWFRGSRQEGALECYKHSLGRTTLMGLEVLVAAAIIRTVILEPTMESVALLGAMIVIRTVLGWTTVLEMTGRWPWQPKRNQS